MSSIPSLTHSEISIEMIKPFQRLARTGVQNESKTDRYFDFIYTYIFCFSRLHNNVGTCYKRFCGVHYNIELIINSEDTHSVSSIDKNDIRASAIILLS